MNGASMLSANFTFWLPTLTYILSKNTGSPWLLALCAAASIPTLRAGADGFKAQGLMASSDDHDGLIDVVTSDLGAVRKGVLPEPAHTKLVFKACSPSECTPH